MFPKNIKYLIQEGENFVKRTKTDGSFVFNPDDIGKKMDFKVATHIEPMGLQEVNRIDITIGLHAFVEYWQENQRACGF